MTEHQTTSDDPIGAYAAGSPPVFEQMHVPERSAVNLEYLRSVPGILTVSYTHLTLPTNREV